MQAMPLAWSTFAFDEVWRGRAKAVDDLMTLDLEQIFCSLEPWDNSNMNQPATIDDHYLELSSNGG